MGREVIHNRRSGRPVPHVVPTVSGVHAQLEVALQAGGGLILRREHPCLVEAIKREHRAGTLVRVLSGTYLTAGLADSVEHRVHALVRYDPDAVVTGTAAARLSWWPELPSPIITAYRAECVQARGFRWLRGRPHRDLVVDHLASPALQVLDMIRDIGSSAVDEALRRRVVSLAALHAALDLTPGRPGNQLRREILADSRDEPWSSAEREFHRTLRAAKVTGWRSNFRVHLDGHTYFLDVALPDLRLAFEVDGFEFHGSRTAFERDRARDALLATRGWQVVRVSAAQVQGCEGLVRAVISSRATHFPRPLRETGSRGRTCGN